MKPTLLHLEKLEHEFSGETNAIRLSHINSYNNQRVIIVDSIGVLSRLYNYADAAFIGGSFKINVHNVLEAAVYGVPVLFGPKIDNSQEAKNLADAGGGILVNDKKEFYRGLPDELRQRVIDDFLAEYTPEDAELDVIELTALGLVEPGFDFLSFFTALLSEQVAGFYDNELKEMYVVAGEDFGGLERLTFSHEYVHALQDHTYDIENGLQFSDEICDVDTERCAAIQALMEGDASTVELEWFMNNATHDDQQEVIDFYNTYTSPVYDCAPDFMKEDFIFPYTYGQTFVDTPT